MNDIVCLSCDWIGTTDELHCRKEDEDKPVAQSRFDRCPMCGSEDDFEDFDDEDEEVA